MSIVNCQLSTPSHAISFDADTIAQALVNIYQKKYGNGTAPEPTLFEKTKEIFSDAIRSGVAGQRSEKNGAVRNDAFVDALRHNTDVFSAFRTHKMQSDIAAQLLDEKGNVKPFGQFVKDVKPYVTHQNRAWLQTEYDTAVLRAHQAADWKQFEAEKDVLPNLEWLPSTSPNPGEDHKPYWFTVLPIDHKFWNNHRPGDRWNCKCRLRNTDKPATAVPAETLVKNLQPSKGLESNPGTTGEIFSNSHPYYPENCGKCPFNKGVGKLFAALVETKRDCNNGCRKIDKAINQSFIEERRKEYEQYKNDPDYLDVQFNPENGALMATHKDHNFDKIGGKYEIQAQKAGFKNGDSVIFGQERNAPAGKKTEGKWNGLFFEVAGRETATENNVLKGLKHCASKKKTEIAVLVFPNGGFNENILFNAINRYRGLEKVKDYPYIKFQKIICIQNEEIVSEIDF